MLREGLIFVGTCDIAGHVRGKGFPASDLGARRKKGIGWTHSNLMQESGKRAQADRRLRAGVRLYGKRGAAGRRL